MQIEKILMFEQIVWKEDRALLGNLVFRLEHYRNESWELGEQCFRFYKIKRLIDQYQQAFARRPGWRPEHVLELGMWDGGSLAFWFELLQPQKMVGLDLTDRTNSEYFKQYVSTRGIEDRIRAYWNTSQADPEALGRIVESDFDGRLDLVMDDASHLYGPSKASFEFLFPRMPEGALYIIEDWAWAHWEAFQTPDHPWADEVPLARLVFDLIEVTASSKIPCEIDGGVPWFRDRGTWTATGGRASRLQAGEPHFAQTGTQAGTSLDVAWCG